MQAWCVARMTSYSNFHRDDLLQVEVGRTLDQIRELKAKVPWGLDTYGLAFRQLLDQCKSDSLR